MARSCEDLRNNDPPDLENNPFLFSTFLKKEAIVNETSPVWKTFDSSSESVDHAPFPDLGSSSAFNQKVKQSMKSKQQKGISNKLDRKKRILKIVDDEVQTLDEKEANQVLENGIATVEERTGDLKLSSSENESEENSDSGDSSPLESSYILQSTSNHSMDSRMKELEEENILLRQTIKQLEKDLEAERETSKKRIGNLVEELRAEKKKELQETATLANVVQMVEENLRQTTQRALKAEANLSKIKEEMKFLREETMPKTRHKQVVEEYEFRLESIRQKSRNAAQLMHTAANKTEPLLKELLAGVSSLHLYAEQFENIDKIIEVDPTRDRVV